MHKKRGLKFFVILCICFLVSIFSLSFQDSFYNEYVKLGIDARNAHLTIVAKDSTLLNNSLISLEKDGLNLIEIDNEFDEFTNNLAEVEIGTPIIETGGAFYTEEGKLQTGGTITGVKATDFKDIFPGIVLLEGKDDITIKPGAKTIPFLRWGVQSSEKIQNIDKFVIENFKTSDINLESIKNEITKDFPRFFKDSTYFETKGTSKFIDDLNLAITKKDLYNSVPKSYTENYNYQIKYIIQRIQTLDFGTQSELKNWNKRLIQTMYPDYINEVPEGIALNKPMGLFVKSVDDTRPPTLIPIEFIGYCEGIPEFYGYNFIDMGVLQSYLDVKPDQYTSYLVRLREEKDLNIVKTKLDKYIIDRGLDYTVVDYKFIGNKTHLPLATAITIVFKFLIVIFLLISIFFISYTVKISLIRRRREMGIVITQGMSRFENSIVFVGENIVIMTVSWIVASVIMGLLLLYFLKNGLSGIIFFPKGILKLNFNYTYFIKSYLLILIPGILASFIPVFGIRHVNIVELLKGELS